MYTSTAQRIKYVIADLAAKYEPGNQKKSIHNVWRIYIKPKYGISYCTLMRYCKKAGFAAKSIDYY
jgi:hypothetical protein